MFRIKLLILFLISCLSISCTNKKEEYNFKMSVAYIGGEYEGLILSNQLKSQLNNLGMLSESSRYEVQANISHSQNLYITNIDNTSDREQIDSNVSIKIFDKKSGADIKYLLPFCSTSFIWIIQQQSLPLRLSQEGCW